MWLAKQRPARGLVASRCHKWTNLVAENCLPRAMARTALEICQQGFGERTKGGTPASSPSTSQGRLFFTLGSETTDPTLLLVSGTAHKALGTSFRGLALCWSVALFASDNRKFLHGRMEGAITHNKGPVRLVVWELLSIRLWQGGKMASCPLAAEGTPDLVATAGWIITNVYLHLLATKVQTNHRRQRCTCTFHCCNRYVTVPTFLDFDQGVPLPGIASRTLKQRLIHFLKRTVNISLAKQVYS